MGGCYILPIIQMSLPTEWDWSMADNTSSWLGVPWVGRTTSPEMILFRFIFLFNLGRENYLHHQGR